MVGHERKANCPFNTNWLAGVSVNFGGTKKSYSGFNNLYSKYMQAQLSQVTRL